MMFTHHGPHHRPAHLSCSKEHIREAFTPWNAREHRLEHVATVNEVHFVNDSSATTVNAAYMALAFTDGPIVWIAGGQCTAPGSAYDSLHALVAEKVRGVYDLSAVCFKLPHHFSRPTRPVLPVQSMREAVVAAFILAEPGDTVLLSPAAAAFDRFADHEERGRAFKREVGAL